MDQAKIIKSISEITRAEWILYQWTDVTLFSQAERTYCRGAQRPIEESIHAAQEWDTYQEALLAYRESKQPVYEATFDKKSGIPIGTLSTNDLPNEHDQFVCSDRFEERIVEGETVYDKVTGCGWISKFFELKAMVNFEGTLSVYTCPMCDNVLLTVRRD